MPDTPATSPAPQRPALSAASQEAVAEVERKLGAGYSMSQATLHVVARLAALEAEVARVTAERDVWRDAVVSAAESAEEDAR